MSSVQCGFRHDADRHDADQHDTEVLVRKVDNRLATLRMAPGRYDVALAELLASSLRALVVATNRASAADRARVRAAVPR